MGAENVVEQVGTVQVVLKSLMSIWVEREDSISIQDVESANNLETFGAS